MRPPPERKTPMLEDFLSLLCGRFNNAAQAAEQQALDPNFPLAAHCNTACNDKIAHLPAGFAGVFVVEESTYTANGKTHASPHLFLFTEEGDGIRLTSYEIPAGYDKDTFTYAAMGQVEYADLVPSKKFTPALYRREGNAWVGGSTSWFTPVLKFTLWERFSPDGLEVSETMELNGKRTFGFDQPLLYRRID